MKYFVYDCETGGRTTKYSLLTMYGQILDDSFEPVDEIDIKISSPTYVVEPEALAINQINLINLFKEGNDIATCRQKMSTFLVKHSNFRQEKITQVGHNIYFDMRFVKKNLLPNFDDFFSHHCLDTASTATLLKLMGKLPGDFKISLGNLAKHYQINHDNLHNAKNDVIVTISVLRCMMAQLKETTNR